MGCIIAIKSNPMSPGWVPHKLKNNYTTEALPQKWKNEPHLRLPSLEVRQQEEEPPENLPLKASVVWSQELHRPGENRNSTLGGSTQGLLHTRPWRGKKQWLYRVLGQAYLLVLEGLLWGKGAAVAHWRIKDPDGELSWRPPLAPPNSLQAPDQIINREETQPHPSVNRVSDGCPSPRRSSWITSKNIQCIFLLL